MKPPKTLAGKLHFLGIAPKDCMHYARLARSLIRKYRCNEMQAIGIARIAYNAAEGFHWNIQGLAFGVLYHTAHPVGPRIPSDKTSFLGDSKEANATAYARATLALDRSSPKTN